MLLDNFSIISVFYFALNYLKLLILTMEIHFNAPYNCVLYNLGSRDGKVVQEYCIQDQRQARRNIRRWGKTLVCYNIFESSYWHKLIQFFIGSCTFLNNVAVRLFTFIKVHLVVTFFYPRLSDISTGGVRYRSFNMMPFCSCCGEVFGLVTHILCT